MIDKENFEKALSLTLKTCENAMKELAQVGAVLQKIKKHFGGIRNATG